MDSNGMKISVRLFQKGKVWGAATFDHIPKKGDTFAKNGTLYRIVGYPLLESWANGQACYRANITSVGPDPYLAEFDAKLKAINEKSS